MKVFLTCYGGAHIAAVLPLYRTLTQRGHECELLALTTAGEVARRERIPHLRPIDFVDVSDPGVRRLGEELARRHHTDGKGLLREESVAYLGVSFLELVEDVGEVLARKRYEKSGLNAFAPVRFMSRILKRVAPDVVVATTSPRMEKAALRAAFRLDIPSLCMVELFGLLEEPWLGRPDNGHVLAVSRHDVVRRLIAAGRDGADIHLTGSPMFDPLAEPALADSGRAWRRTRGIGDNEKVVFWAEQPEPADPDLPRRVRYHLAAVCRERGWRLVVRLHPSSTDHAAESMPEGCIHSLPQEALAHVIHACDVGVTLTSTVGWELLLCDKPVLVLRLSAFQDAVTYGEGDGALAVNCLSDAGAGLLELLEDGPVAREMRRLRALLPRPGGASDRISDLLETTVQPRRYSLELNRTSFR